MAASTYSHFRVLSKIVCHFLIEFLARACACRGPGAWADVIVLPELLIDDGLRLLCRRKPFSIQDLAT